MYSPIYVVILRNITMKNENNFSTGLSEGSDYSPKGTLNTTI